MEFRPEAHVIMSTWIETLLLHIFPESMAQSHSNLKDRQVPTM